MVTHQGGKTAVFESDITPEGKPLVGLYPYDSEATFSDGIVSTVIPSVQTPVVNNVDPLAFISVGKADDDNNIAFHNVCGGIRFTVSNDMITRVVFKGNDGELISGDILIEPSDFAASANAGASEFVELSSDTPLTPGTFYYITFLPRYFAKGFTFEFFDSHGESVSTSVCSRPISINRSVYSTLRNADDPEAVSEILTGEDLSVDGTHTANCYIVSSSGYYKFPACKGLSHEYIQGIASLNATWESSNSSKKPTIGDYITDIAYKGGYIYFRVIGLSSEEIDNGNALIAARDESGSILWSWHVWLCNGFDADETAVSIQPSGKLFMDRNLGALSSAKDCRSYGLLYQWGRKDPFMGISYDAPTEAMAYTSSLSVKSSNSFYGKVVYAVGNPICYITSTSDWMHNPDANLWSETKTDYDPCPYGWKVPSVEAFQDCEITVCSNPNGIALKGEDPEELWLPACGYRDKTSELVTSLTDSWYWTSSSAGKFSKAVFADYSGKSTDLGKQTDRAMAFAVRCVKDETD